MRTSSSSSGSPRLDMPRMRASVASVWEQLQTGPDLETVRLIRDGLPPEILQLAAQSLNVQPENLCAMLRIRQPKSMPGARLSKSDGGKILTAILALREATRTLESVTGAKQWLLRPLRSLGGAAPLSLLDTPAGFELVRQTMRRVEHGICA